MTSAQVVETSVTNNSSFQNYPHPDDHTIRTTDTENYLTSVLDYIVIQMRKINREKGYCVVPENTHTPTMEGISSKLPLLPGISIFWPLK